jgi:hypothetical protein
MAEKSLFEKTIKTDQNYGAPFVPQKKKKITKKKKKKRHRHLAVKFGNYPLFFFLDSRLFFFSLGCARIITVGFRLYVKVVTGVCV